MTPKHSPQLIRFAAILVAAGVATSVLLTIRSYSCSYHLTYSDVELSTDEGLFSVMVPLARLAHGHDATNRWETYTLAKANGWQTDRWVGGGGTKFKTREYFAVISKSGDDAAIQSRTFLGFGYLLADSTLTSVSRPGSLLWIIAPIWAVVAVGIAAIGMPIYFRARFGIRSLMILTLAAAVILLLPTLHAPP
ncbi:hypothetical protein Rcae01_00311 [Novipirellula caenicola]|uniref:Uncharacterized protein n=1 Tax=Novipirellula caenicola TaxID=1536901 RepID=A0ABP9VI45_9BACT